MNPIAIGGIAFLLALLTGMSGDSSPEVTRPSRPPPPRAQPYATPGSVLIAYIETVAQQGLRPRLLTELISKNLVLKGRTNYAAVLLPCDQSAPGQLPTPEYLFDIASGIAESYGVEAAGFPLQWNHETTGPMAMCAIIFHAPDSPPPSQSDAIRHFTKQLAAKTEQFGSSYGFIDLIINSMVASAVGTVTSLGVQDLVHAAGGERKLARLTMKYKAAKARGGATRASHLLAKLTRVASKIKGRTVDWQEVDALIKREDVHGS